MPHEEMSWHVNVIWANLFPTKLQNILFYVLNVYICLPTHDLIVNLTKIIC